MASVPNLHPTSLRPTFPIRTERLLLRPLVIDDADALLAYRSRKDVCRYVPFEPMSRDDIIERISGQWTRTELTDAGQSLTLGAEVAGTGEVAGDVVLFWHSRGHAGGELGYVFNPALGGHGYATEAATATLRLGFEGLGLHRIVARIDERNGPSARLARRLGMRQEARLVDNEFFKGEWTTELDFALLAQEWHARRNGGAGQRLRPDDPPANFTIRSRTDRFHARDGTVAWAARGRIEGTCDELRTGNDDLGRHDPARAAGPGPGARRGRRHLAAGGRHRQGRRGVP